VPIEKNREEIMMLMIEIQEGREGGTYIKEKYV
jgi:hypothetical protein